MSNTVMLASTFGAIAVSTAAMVYSYRPVMEDYTIKAKKRISF